jgi:hypothetical protein
MVTVTVLSLLLWQEVQMILPRILLLSAFAFNTLVFAANVPKAILPDNVVLCEPNAGCVNQTLYGRNYKVISTPRFKVMVAVSQEGAYTRADVSVTNNTDVPLNVTPEDFRVEVLTPKPKVLQYVPPSDLKDLPSEQPQAPVAPASSPAAAPSAQPMASSLLAKSFQSSQTVAASDIPASPAEPAAEVEVHSAAEQQKLLLQEAAINAEKIDSQKHLAPTSVPPSEVTRGRVYFERDKHAHLVNVVLPIAGLVFEFPYAMKK